MSCCVSITELTTASAWIAGLAIVALVASGWRKPARATPAFARARRSSRRPTSGVELLEDAVPIHRGTPWWRRTVAVFGSSVIAVVMGAVLATIVAVGIAYSVITLTTMLRK
jgi:hypothetical protein